MLSMKTQSLNHNLGKEYSARIAALRFADIRKTLIQANIVPPQIKRLAQPQTSVAKQAQEHSKFSVDFIRRLEQRERLFRPQPIRPRHARRAFWPSQGHEDARPLQDSANDGVDLTVAGCRRGVRIERQCRGIDTAA